MINKIGSVAASLWRRPEKDVMTEFRKILSDCGYHIFTVNPNRRQFRSNMVIVHPDDAGSAMFVYERDGKVFVRPWNSSGSYGPYNGLVRRLSAKTKRNFNLHLGGILKLRKGDPNAWTSWLSEASVREARLLGYGV